MTSETTCPVCGATVTTTTKGTIRAHDRNIARGDFTESAGRCPGSGVEDE